MQDLDDLNAVFNDIIENPVISYPQAECRLLLTPEPLDLTLSYPFRFFTEVSFDRINDRRSLIALQLPQVSNGLRFEDYGKHGRILP